MKTLCVIAILLSSFCSYAESKPDVAKIYKDAKQRALDSMSQIANNDAKANKILSAIQHSNNQPSNTAKELGNLPKMGEEAKEASPSCNSKDCNLSNVFSAKAVRTRESNLEKYGFRKNQDNYPENNKGYLDRANKQIKEAALNQHSSITGQYKDCAPFEQVFRHKQEQTCDRYFDIKYDNCPVSQIVEIDPKYTYLCNKKREEVIKTCHDNIASISCNKSVECDGGGLIRSSFAGEISWEYIHPTLRIGTVGDNSICGHCRTLDNRTEFEIKNLAKLTEFTLLELHYDDYLWIQLNGHNIFIGPESGQHIEVRGNTVSAGGKSKYSCERNNSWHHLGINRDLRPYLKEGKNVLFTRLIVSGCGEFWMYIRARQYCCKEWNITREEKCEFDGVRP